jgi:hypothetical protein
VGGHLARPCPNTTQTLSAEIRPLKIAARVLPAQRRRGAIGSELDE